jgi:predicted secreted hydrolase
MTGTRAGGGRSRTRRRGVSVALSLVAVSVGTTLCTVGGTAQAATVGGPGLPGLQGCLGAAGAPGPAPAATATKTPAPVAAPVPGPAQVHLPQDEAAHHQPVEWWYFSGHLRGVDAAGHVHCYGFEYVTFQFLSFGPIPVYVGNFAVTDLSRKSFHYGAQTATYPVPALKDAFSAHTGGWTMSGGNGHDALEAALDGYTLHLHLQASAPAVLEGNGGLVTMGTLGSSKYYSWTSLVTTGTMVDHGVSEKVTGLSWMDHQWGAMDLTSGGGWDWYSVQLSDGDQYMLYFLRNPRGTIVQSFGTRVSPSGLSQRLASVRERATGTWHSPASAVTYSSGWQLTVPGGQLDVRPDLADQELDLKSSAQGNVYWEGDVSVTGHVDGASVAGVGYTELNPPGH